MNLWVKRTGQLLLAALFLMACEDESSLLGFKNPISPFDVKFVDIPLESSISLIDSVRTDNQQFNVISRLLIGRVNDPLLGDVSATPFMQLRPGTTDTIPTTSVYDSLVLEIQLDNYAYGASGISQETFSIHEITEDSISYSIPIKPYYYHNSLGYGSSMGSKTFDINHELLKTLRGQSQPDSVIILRIKLNENTDFNARLFNLIKNNPNNSFKDPKKFRFAIKGLVLVPENPSASILGFTGAALSQSKLTLHYHTDTDTLARPFFLDAGSFINITTNRMGELAGLPLYESNQPASDLRYVQNGSPVITRVDLSNFYDFIETVPKTIFNAAELVIESVETPGVFDPPPSIVLRTIKEDNLFFNRKTEADRNAMAPQFVLIDTDYYVVRSDVSSGTQSIPTSLNYSSGKYTGNMTLFIQTLFNQKGDEPKFRYLGLYSSNIGKTVNRVAFNKDKVKLRLYYTVPTTE
ncbi:MAG: DUF4270 family protein [Cyclobacteriaceae bacterium]|nr:DUF4270 family protein [Cyclobacteriaceae bacterium]